jgi:hypothetical protein
MKNYKSQLDAMRQMINNIEFHTNYNHPTEALNVLIALQDKVSAMEIEVKADE